ncbi:hypothetical protein GCM10007276_35920 [Agaricicola taiwanensis]|uniref:Uncharacterized protein n=1 Tax=Agaricicola taiwanensis TaxID=591372 RepID=A0A8J3DZU7_9RHOB|nr:hypothetical protein [Agaricicola taiwanensis]GGE55671.1 hypothetical protein GCM10007276_35920 [Agaricicola taiwanensis]
MTFHQLPDLGEDSAVEELPPGMGWSLFFAWLPVRCDRHPSGYVWLEQAMRRRDVNGRWEYWYRTQDADDLRRCSW